VHIRSFSTDGNIRREDSDSLPSAYDFVHMIHTSRGAQLRRSDSDEGMLVEVLNFHARVPEKISSHYGRTIGQIDRVIHCGASRLRNVCWERGLAQKGSLVSSMP
jgi:hypothetical protein